ncbi:CsbD family protein [Oxalobacteraceae bacterium CAVE-383]|nr:CsbD family protein [Oxalobacteraceae bacterium CAVE-383]
MNKDQVKGAVKEAAGNVQKKAGEVTGSASQQVKGAAREAEGNVQKNYGNVKETVKNANK